jgi:hypothetical protein
MLFGFRLFLFALSVSGVGISSGEAASIADDVRAVVLEEEPLFAGEDAEERTAQMLIVFAKREAAFRNDLIGDQGAACSVLQLHELARDGHSCAELQADRRLALRVGLAWMRRMRDVCGGSVRAGLRAFASGVCAGSPRGRVLVESRCRAIQGGCESILIVGGGV